MYSCFLCFLPANAKLKHKVDSVNHVIDTEINAKLKTISELFLFDTDLAFSRSWVSTLTTW